MPNVFSKQTLRKFEDASASIPLRQLDRVFESAGIRPGEDPGGGDGGARRTQFRRYVAGVDQHDPRQLDRLGDALGALIGEVAESKQEYLVTAAEREGFVFANGIFRPATTKSSSSPPTRAQASAPGDDREARRRLTSDRRLFSHVDLRVRDIERALVFYDALMAAFGFEQVANIFARDEPTWRRPQWQANDEFFGLTVDRELVPNSNRVAFQAYTREEVDRATEAARGAGAVDVDGPRDYGGYYASFFDDPDGNRLEICYLTKHRGVASNG